MPSHLCQFWVCALRLERSGSRQKFWLNGRMNTMFSKGRATSFWFGTVRAQKGHDDFGKDSGMSGGPHA